MLFEGNWFKSPALLVFPPDEVLDADSFPGLRGLVAPKPGACGGPEGGGGRPGTDADLGALPGVGPLPGGGGALAGGFARGATAAASPSIPFGDEKEEDEGNIAWGAPTVGLAMPEPARKSVDIGADRLGRSLLSSAPTKKLEKAVVKLLSFCLAFSWSMRSASDGYRKQEKTRPERA